MRKTWIYNPQLPNKDRNLDKFVDFKYKKKLFN
jgi:hypothetical protein